MCSKMNVGVHARIKSKFIDLFFLIYGHKKLGGGGGDRDMACDS